MALMSTFDKTRKDIEKKLADAAPLEALAGAGDFAVEKLRSARADIATRVEGFDAKALRDQAQATVVTGVDKLETELKAAPGQAKAQAAKAQAVLGGAMTAATTTAVTAYGDLSERGKSLVTRVRGQASTAEVEEQAAETADAATATMKTAAKGVTDTAAAVADSADKTAATAKKSAAKTRSTAKKTSSSAKKTSAAAKKAAADTADTVGD